MERFCKSRSWIKNCLVVSALILMAAALVGCRPRVDEIPRPANGITTEDLATYTRELADDALLGRGTGGEGQAPTLAYLQAAYERIGLKPMGNSTLPNSSLGSAPFFQEVELIGIAANPTTARLSFKGFPQAEALDLKYGSDFVAWTPEPEGTLDVSGDLVFVGYGINASEEGWNDYQGVDVTDKIVLVLVGDPPLEDQSRFGGKAMTYYGRYTYKIEEAARQGAAGVLLIHDTEAAGYGWNVIQGWTGEQLWLSKRSVLPPMTPLQAWISSSAAERIFDSAGAVLEDLVAAAGLESFIPMDFGVTGAAHLENATRAVISYNVIGGVTGSDPELADEYIIYTAHWDHLGVGDPVDGDSIYNGALDNATGTAALLEIAESWAISQPAPRRSALFIATTAEEWSFWGSITYVESPIVPLEKTLAVINIDVVNVWGPTEDMTIIGQGMSSLEDDIRAVLAGQQRDLSPELQPEKGSYFRSDHFPFAQAGIPGLYTDCGTRFVGKPDGFARKISDDYTANHYHQPSDEFDPSWDFRGAAQDVEALLQVGLRVAASDTWPEWRANSEFKAAREAMLQAQ